MACFLWQIGNCSLGKLCYKKAGQVIAAIMEREYITTSAQVVGILIQSRPPVGNADVVRSKMHNSIQVRSDMRIYLCNFTTLLVVLLNQEFQTV